MEEGKEILWIANLYNQTDLSNSLFSRKGGTFEDFEKRINNSIGNKKYRVWFNKMFEEGTIFLLEKRENSRGNPTKIYSINKKKLFRYFERFDSYLKFRKIIWDNDI